jgi:hypothetical protein
MIRPPPSRAFPAKKEWSNLCQNLAATAHSKTFAEWKCKQADTIYSTSASALSELKPDQPRHELLEATATPPDELTSILALRSHTIGLRGDWSNRRTKNSEAELCQSCLRHHNYAHLDDLASAFSNCKTLSQARLEITQQLSTEHQVHVYPQVLNLTSRNSLAALATFYRSIQNKIRQEKEELTQSN